MRVNGAKHVNSRLGTFESATRPPTEIPPTHVSLYSRPSPSPTIGRGACQPWKYGEQTLQAAITPGCFGRSASSERRTDPQTCKASSAAGRTRRRRGECNCDTRCSATIKSVKLQTTANVSNPLVATQAWCGEQHGAASNCGPGRVLHGAVVRIGRLKSQITHK